MIELTIGAKGKLTAAQQIVSPAVYLDHWALRAVSADIALSERFTKVLEARAGALLLSCLAAAGRALRHDGVLPQSRRLVRAS